jgi:methionine-rich copper-binding protein CopC
VIRKITGAAFFAQLLAALAVLAVLALTGAGAASAHAIRISADPAPDSAVDKGPERVSGTFNEQLQTSFAAMTVVGPDGNLWSTGPTDVQGAVASVGLRPLGPVGTYTVNYRVTSADGHVVSGSWSFRLTTAGAGTPGPPVGATGPADEGVPVWPFIAAAVAIVGAGAWWAVRRRA